MEVVLPIEVEIPSLRVLMEAKLEESEWVQTRFDQLNLIEEKRLAALFHGQLYLKILKKSVPEKNMSSRILGRRLGAEKDLTHSKGLS